MAAWSTALISMEACALTIFFTYPRKTSSCSLSMVSAGGASSYNGWVAAKKHRANHYFWLPNPKHAFLKMHWATRNKEQVFCIQCRMSSDSESGTLSPVKHFHQLLYSNLWECKMSLQWPAIAGDLWPSSAADLTFWAAGDPHTIITTRSYQKQGTKIYNQYRMSASELALEGGGVSSESGSTSKLSHQPLYSNLWWFMMSIILFSSNDEC